ncbi:unnamed protein product [Linum trigynum]|uniref:Uncharacterized protein n=1 Tax=Linum trigynum TaxID=586398 RepID=A0AAV2FCB1_9ROSI
MSSEGIKLDWNGGHGAEGGDQDKRCRWYRARRDDSAGESFLSAQSFPGVEPSLFKFGLQNHMPYHTSSGSGSRDIKWVRTQQGQSEHSSRAREQKDPGRADLTQAQLQWLCWGLALGPELAYNVEELCGPELELEEQAGRKLNRAEHGGRKHVANGWSKNRVESSR